MAKKKLKQVRHFSPTIKKQVVALIEQKQLNVATAAREYGVHAQTIYNWIYRYSSYNANGGIMMVDKKHQQSQLAALQQQVQQLQSVLGQKQMQLDYWQKYAELLAQDVPDADKKKEAIKPYGTSVTTGPNTDGR